MNAGEGQDETSHTSVLPVTEGQELSLPGAVCSSTPCHRDIPVQAKQVGLGKPTVYAAAAAVAYAIGQKKKKKRANEQNKQMCQVTVCTARDTTGLPLYAAPLGACTCREEHSVRCEVRQRW